MTLSIAIDPGRHSGVAWWGEGELIGELDNV